MDKTVRRGGLSLMAVRGTLELIHRSGGGVVEAYPHDNNGKRMSNLYNGTRSLFEAAGFSYVRPKGTQNCVVRIAVA